ncbi:MAG: hypothetical protein Q9224_000379, partial [Gallowayella concinna]
MTTKLSAPLNAKRVLLFGGQGSTTIFSSVAATASRDIVQTSSEAATLLSRCHAAFLEDLRSIGHRDLRMIAINISTFHDPQSLLSPPKSYHQNGIIQGTTLLIHQLLHYLAYVEKPNRTFEAVFDEIDELTGFCSGILPSLVVASSQNVRDFIQHGVEAFRVAFWIACRGTLKCHHEFDLVSDDNRWMMTISGIKQFDLQTQLDTYCTQVGREMLHISAILESELLTISGPPQHLQAFKKQRISKFATRPVEIWCWYHGGSQLETVSEEVQKDLTDRGIQFPTFADLKKPVRSTCDGSALIPHEGITGVTLTEWTIRGILVNCVDWNSTVKELFHAIIGSQQGTAGSKRSVTSFGPASKTLLAWTKLFPADDGVQIEDASRFQQAKTPSDQNDLMHDIAIVGMGVNLPSGNGPEELWNTLSQGLSAVTEVGTRLLSRVVKTLMTEICKQIPESRFKLSEYYSPDQGSKDRTMSARSGAFLDNIWGFDNSFFNISPREARSMDPQQRILLHTSQVALEDAGYVSNATPSFQSASMGCYIGLATGDYTDNLRNSIDVYYSPGTLRAFHSGRVSYVNKFSGPSVVSDTACSSSITALYQACRAIQNNDCTAALAGGVNAMCSPDMYLGLSRGHFLSSTGGCKSFDENADGYCRAEGSVMFVLKRLSDAIKEEDRILGTIKGIELNHSGKSHSITHPHSDTQTALISKLLANGNIDPASISVVEAHGTGTQAGDVCESRTLAGIFGNSHEHDNPVIVSSIKGNIGHCEAASGAAGLAKLLLMLQKEAVPMQAGLTNLNPRLHGFGEGRLVIPRETRPWKNKSTGPRRALLNNFGAAGSNGALILEEPPPPLVISYDLAPQRSAYLFNLSAKSAEALQRRYLLYCHRQAGNPQPQAIAILLGEYAALAISDALSIETALYVVASRARLMVNECIRSTSGMLACELSPSKAEEMLAGDVGFVNLTVACKNSNKDCVLAGPLDQLEMFKETCKTRRIKAKLLDVPYGFHSRAMDPIIPKLEEIGRSVEWSRPNIPILSGTSGKWLVQEDCDSTYFARHARQPVLFVDCIDSLMRKGTSADAHFVEIGPHPITLPMIFAHLGTSSQTSLATLRKGQPAWTSLVSLLCKLFDQTDVINWRAVFADSGARMTNLPGYPMQYTDFEVQYQETSAAHLDEAQRPDICLEDTGYKLLRKYANHHSSSNALTLETDLQTLAPLISGHKVSGTALCPASVFHELALEAGSIFLDLQEGQVIVVEDLMFPNPLTYDPADENKMIRVAMNKESRSVPASFRVVCVDARGTREILCSTGVIVVKDRFDLEIRWKRHSAMIAKHNEYLSNGPNNNVSTIQTNVLYNHIFARVVQYSDEYQSISSLNVSHNLEAIGTFQLRFGPKDIGFVVPPVFTDTLLHAAGFVANVHVPIDTICICSGVQSLEVLYDQFQYDRAFTVYCSLYEADQGSVIADAYALDFHGHTVAIVYGMEFKKLKHASFRRHLETGQLSVTHNPGRNVTRLTQQSRPSRSLDESGEKVPAQFLSTLKSEARVSGQAIGDKFRAIISEVCGISKNAMNTKVPLEALGIDSLLHIELLAKFTEAFPTADLDQDRLSSCDTLLAMETEINSALGTSIDESPSPVDGASSPGVSGPSSPASSISLPERSGQQGAIQLQKSTSKAAPLYLFHDGSGQTSMYRRVEDLDRNVYAFSSSRQSTPELRHTSLHDMAGEYVSHLSKNPTCEPIILAGWSFGGVVAFESACLLLQAGQSVQGLILIDAPLPIHHTPLPQELVSHLFGEGKAGVDSKVEISKDAILKQFQYHTKLLAEHRVIPLDKELWRGVKTVILRSDNTLDTKKLCGVSYEWLNSEKMQKEVVQGWKSLVGETIGVLTIPGNHFEAFDHGN